MAAIARLGMIFMCVETGLLDRVGVLGLVSYEETYQLYFRIKSYNFEGVVV